MVIEEPRPKKRPTIITYVIIVICVVAFIFTLGPDGNYIRSVPGWWFVPEEMFAGVNLHTLVTAAFCMGAGFTSSAICISSGSSATTLKIAWGALLS